MAKFMRRMQQQYVQRQQQQQQQLCNTATAAAATSSEPHGRQAFFFVLFVFGIPCWLGAPKKGPTGATGRYFSSFFPGR